MPTRVERNQAGALQRGHVGGDGGLGEAELGLDVAHADAHLVRVGDAGLHREVRLGVAQPLEHLEAHGVGERLEDLDEVRGGVVLSHRYEYRPTFRGTSI
ncbi:hypothetical protein GCM10020220_062440 [Nonomuraea rubra]